MSVYYQDERVTLWCGDVLEVLRADENGYDYALGYGTRRAFPDASVDSVVCDPPYGLEFMGKTWDRFDEDSRARAGMTGTGYADGAERLERPSFLGGLNPKCRACGQWQRGGNPCRCDAPDFPNERRARSAAFGDWCLDWATECLRVLKPGGHMLAFGGTRTWHRLACAVEDAGFEVRDSIAWLYGSGFPKSLDVSKAIDKAAGAQREVLAPNPWAGRRAVSVPGGGSVPTVEGGDYGPSPSHLTAPATPDAAKWAGFGTALKPAFEPIVVARKPLSGTVASNVLEYGCGAINIDGCRVQADGGSGQGRRREAPARGCRVHDVRPVREADGAVAVAGQAGEVADDVQQDVPIGTDAGREQPQLARGQLAVHEVRLPPGGDGELVPGGPGAPADATAEGVPGAPSSHGPEGGQAAHDGRDGAPHQRREGRQSTGEPAPDRLGRPQQGAPADRARTDATTGGERPTPGCTCGTDREATRVGESSADRRYTDKGGTNFAPLPGVRGGSPAGRWPANVLLDDSQAAELDRQSGETSYNPAGAFGTQKGNSADSGDVPYGSRKDGDGIFAYGDRGGASRFFPTFRYEAKAPSGERPRIDGIAHPTVKPLDLMRWLVRLVTPPGGTVLEPFAGSGTTVEAAIVEGFHCIAIEREADYLPLIMQRINRRLDPVAAIKQTGDDLGLFDLEGLA